MQDNIDKLNRDYLRAHKANKKYRLTLAKRNGYESSEMYLRHLKKRIELYESIQERKNRTLWKKLYDYILSIWT